jgi:hypothetical protein
VDILSWLSTPFVLLDAILPLLLLVAGAVVVTGNLAAKRFFDSCGVDLNWRYAGGLFIGLCGLALMVQLSSLQAAVATIAVIILLTVLAGAALWRGSRHVAALSLTTAAILIPVAIV